jgi:hypothetical protein
MLLNLSIKAVLEDLQLEVDTEWFFTSGSLFCLEAIMTIPSTLNISTTFIRLTSRTTNGKNWNQQVILFLKKDLNLIDYILNKLRHCPSCKICLYHGVVTQWKDFNLWWLQQGQGQEGRG